MNCALIPAFTNKHDRRYSWCLLEVCQQVLVVDDGSGDDTAILAQSGAQVISLPVNRERGGYQPAYLT